jgi:uncharacterized protein (DUF433 family)
VVSSSIQFNQGIFTVPEVALFARLHTSTVKRWFFGTNMGRPVLPHESNGGEKALGFLEFVQALAIRTLRRDYKLGLSKIREAIERAEHDYGVKHLFARPHQTVLFGREIFIYPDGQPAPVQITGKQVHQLGLRQVVETYQRDLSFDEEGLAHLYHAFRFRDRAIVINPAVRFGEPYVESCGYTAKTLRDAVLSEGGVSEAAKAFGVAEDEVEVAYRYFDSLEQAA